MIEESTVRIRTALTTKQFENVLNPNGLKDDSVNTLALQSYL